MAQTQLVDEHSTHRHAIAYSEEAVNISKSVCVVRHVCCKHFQAERDHVLRVAGDALMARGVLRSWSKPAAGRVELRR